MEDFNENITKHNKISDLHHRECVNRRKVCFKRTLYKTLYSENWPHTRKFAILNLNLSIISPRREHESKFLPIQRDSSPDDFPETQPPHSTDFQLNFSNVSKNEPPFSYNVVTVFADMVCFNNHTKYQTKTKNW